MRAILNSFIPGLLIGLISAGIVAVIISKVIVAKVMFQKGVDYRKKTAEHEIGSAEQKALDIVSEATKEGEGKKREYLLQAKEEIHKTRIEIEKEAKERKSDIQRQERRIIQKEESLDKKIDMLEKKEEKLADKSLEIEKLIDDTNEIKNKQTQELERVSGLTSEDAKQYLLKIVENDVKHEMAIIIKENEAKAKEESENMAKSIIATAIQRFSAEHVSEITVSVVNLPNDEMKGRIIGREGRNIRALETLTGVDLIIDDTPEAVILSGFDPIKREIARLALEKLIVDGRIHPTRIEEMVDKARKEIDNTIKQEGDRAAFETGVHGLHPEILKLLGRLKYRTSYGQNVLDHSIQVANIAGIMAAELGIDVAMAKRGGLLHDIGKAVDHEYEGSHITIGADICKKYNEGRVVINCVTSHHGDEEPESLTAVLVQASDSISAARPGARRETLETYIKRIEKLEEITSSFEGVEKSYAIQAGREVRIMVKPEGITDSDIVVLARDIVKKIESELDYPGQIKINVIRETRAIDYAK